MSSNKRHCTDFQCNLNNWPNSYNFLALFWGNRWEILMSIIFIHIYFKCIMDRHLCASHTILQLILPRSTVHFSVVENYRPLFLHKQYNITMTIKTSRKHHLCVSGSPTEVPHMAWHVPSWFCLYPTSMGKLDHFYIATCLRTMKLVFNPPGRRGL